MYIVMDITVDSSGRDDCKLEGKLLSILRARRQQALEADPLF